MRATPAIHPTRAAAVLFVLAATATGFDYIWFGYATATTWLTLLTLVYIWVERRREGALRHVLHSMGPSVALPWLLLLGSIAFTDALREMSDASWSALVGYGLVSLLLFVVAATTALEADSRRACLALATIVLVQGSLAIAQYFDVPYAWGVPELFSPWVKLDPDDHALLVADEAQLLGRSRGTHVFVHKFAPFLAVLTSLLMAPATFDRRRLGIDRGSMALLRIAVLAGVVGTLVTFSRAAIFGIGLSALAITLAHVRGQQRRWRLIVPIVLIAIAAWVGAQLGVYDQDGFARVLALGGEQFSIESRSLVFARAVEIFLENPILGSGTRVDTHMAGISIHSVVLRMFASYGVVGAAFYLATLIGLARIFLSLRTVRNPWGFVWMVGSLCALATALLDSSTHTSGFLFRDVAQPAIFGVLAGQALRIGWRVRSAR